MGAPQPGRRRRQALVGLQASVDALVVANQSLRATTQENERLLAECHEAIRQVDDALVQIEHQVRGSLTVVKGRAQLLRRHALDVPRPDARVVAGLSAIDAAVDRLVGQLDDLLDGAAATGSAGADPGDDADP